MSLDPVTSGLGKGLQTGGQVGGQATDTVKSVANEPVQQVTDTTNALGDNIIPGEFPSDDAADQKYEGEQPANVSFTSLWTSFSAWVTGLVPRAFDGFENFIRWLVQKYLPPPKQAAIYEAALKRPIASTFLVCQAICCGVPLLVFLVGVAIFAVVAVVLWAVLALLILGPILLVASMMGVSLWGWGWVLYGLVKWVDQKFLGGMITRFWSPQGQGEQGKESMEEDEDGNADGDGGLTEGEKKDN